MRAAIARLLWNDQAMNNLGFRRDSTFAGDVDTPEPRPYLVLRWGETSAGVDVSRRRVLTVWIHDKPNDYTTIDNAIKRIRQLFEAVAGLRTENGWVTAVDWLTDSEDLTDDGTNTICRNTTYTVVGSGL